MSEGRSREQQRKLIRESTDAFLRRCDVKAKGHNVIIKDDQIENWGSGGEFCADKFSD
ncbi:MAG: tautomerase family protein [Pseudomonadota bacterium]